MNDYTFFYFLENLSFDIRQSNENRLALKMYLIEKFWEFHSWKIVFEVRMFSGKPKEDISSVDMT